MEKVRVTYGTIMVPSKTETIAAGPDGRSRSWRWVIL